MLEIVFNNLTKPDGSALVEQNNTMVQAAVFGPIEASQARVNHEEAVIEINYKPKVSIPSSNPEFEAIREIEFNLKSIFRHVILTRMHPRTIISIIVHEIFNSGSLLTVAINAICCALLDAGLPLRTPVAALTIVTQTTEKDGQPELIIQPNRLEEDNYESKFVLVYDSQSNLISVKTRGKLALETLKKCVELGKDESKAILDTYRSKISDRFIA